MDDPVKAFLTKIIPMAHVIEQESGIHTIVAVTQAGHESRYGQSQLTVLGNNLFGFTGDTWAEQKKPVLWMKTGEFAKGVWKEIERPFRAYTSWEESLRDWARLMQTQHYALALPFAKSGDVEKFSYAVQAAGYATDPAYATNMMYAFGKINEAMA